MTQVPITLLPEDIGRRDADSLGLIVRFDPVTYPQLRQVGRKFVHYELQPGSIDPASLDPTTFIANPFSMAWMAVTVEKCYGDFPYRGGDFGLHLMADDPDEKYMLGLDFDSVPVDPSESYHEGLLKVHLQPLNRKELYYIL